MWIIEVRVCLSTRLCERYETLCMYELIRALENDLVPLSATVTTVLSPTDSTHT
jgi:hypothetical protein